MYEEVFDFSLSKPVLGCTSSSAGYALVPGAADEGQHALDVGRVHTVLGYMQTTMCCQAIVFEIPQR